MRLRKRKEYLHAAKHGNTATGKFIRIQSVHSTNEKPCLGITVTRRFGNAVSRNTFKRKVREAYRHLAPNLKGGWNYVIKPRKFASKASLHDIQNELFTLIEMTQAHALPSLTTSCSINDNPGLRFGNQHIVV